METDSHESEIPPYTDTTVNTVECSRSSTSATHCGKDLCGPEATAIPAAAKADSQEEIDLTKLLSKLKSEETFELRKLKHHQHPVSEFSSKQQLEQILLSKCKQAPASSVSGSTSNSVQATSLTHSRVKEFDSRAQAAAQVQQTSRTLMPESIQLEIRGLFERRVVTGMLQSPVQAEIERVVQEQRQQQQQGSRPRRRRARPLPPAARESNGAAGRVMAAVRNGARSRGASYHRIPRVHHSRPTTDGNYPIPQRNQARIMDHLRQSPALNSLDQGAREEIVSEVSNLVHQQLVTSALSGEFRGVLELHIQERVDRVGEGQTGEDFLQSLNRRHSSGQSNAENNRAEGGASYNEVHTEVQEMKSQLAELKQMMRVSFDLQMDIQRSIRQEVAAALSLFLAQSPPSHAAPLQGSPGFGSTAAAACPIPTLVQVGSSLSSSQRDGARVVEAGHCVICSDGVIDSVVYRCGHMCVCMACGLELKGQGLKCPICRAPITDVIRAYASML